MLPAFFIVALKMIPTNKPPWLQRDFRNSEDNQIKENMGWPFPLTTFILEINDWDSQVKKEKEKEKKPCPKSFRF